jgi:signal transduction histidine kinase
MLDYFDVLRRANEFAPHGYCLLWQPELIWTHVIGDALIAGRLFLDPDRHRPFRHPADRHRIQLDLLAVRALHHRLRHHPPDGDLDLVEPGLRLGSADQDHHRDRLRRHGDRVVAAHPRALALPSPLQLREANLQLNERVRERDDALERLKREVLDRERAEAALVQAQKMDAVGQLTGGIAHDFNNLLAVVIGNLDMIGRKTEDERTRRLAGNALQAAERGAKVTGQLLAFSRTQRLQVQPTQIGPLIEGVRDLLRQTLGPAIELQLEVADAGLPVLADPTQLELAILNLAINARDAMPNGGSLTIAAQRLDVQDDPDLTDGEYLELAVTDTGAGMSEDVIERAFDPFFTTKQVGQGTGLGLSMVYGVARQSGGVARIRSRVGQGTTVSVILPRTLQAAAEQKVSADAEPGAAPVRARVLVVDDEPEVRRVLAETLEELGHETAVAAGGQEALDLLAASSFDLLMLDFAMPGMNGAEVATAARALRPDQKLIFVTGYADTGAIEAAAADSLILRKPFRASEVAQAVQSALVPKLTDES